jgi:4-hydroxybenzoate polyprenyltransferase
MNSGVTNQNRSTEFGKGDHAVSRFLRLIRFSHTVFALPFALGALVVAANGLPSTRTFLLVLACMICARTAAMLFNRLADWSLDQRNPRTESRHRLVSKNVAVIGFVVAAIGFLAAAAFLNRLTFLLCPLALAVVLLYSFTKRFTWLTHFFLGLALAIAPIGAWIAERGSIDVAPLLLAGGVLCWVAGFDVIYATQDYDFDQRENLRSMVVTLGIARSLKFAQLLHLLALAGLVAFGVASKLGPIYYGAMALILATRVYEHRRAVRLNVDAVNRAFFQSNAFVSATFVIGVSLDRLTHLI